MFKCIKGGSTSVEASTREVRRTPNLPTFDAELPKRPTRPFVPSLCERARAPYYLAHAYRFNNNNNNIIINIIINIITINKHNNKKKKKNFKNLLVHKMKSLVC